MSTVNSLNRISLIIRASLWERRGYLFTVALALVVMGLAQGGLLFVIGPFLKVLVSLGEAQKFIPLQDLLPKQAVGFFPSSLHLQLPTQVIVTGIPLMMVAIGTIRSVAMYLYQRSQAGIALTVAKNTRNALFSALLKHSYSDLSKKSAAHWMSMIMNDVLFLQMRFSEIMTVLLKDSVLVASCLVAMFVIHWQTGLCLLLISPFVAYGLGRAGRRISMYANYWQRELSKIATFVLDIRQRFVFIRAQRGEVREFERFKEKNESYYRSIRKSIFLRAAFAPVVEWLGFVLFAVFVYVVAKGQWGEDFSSATMIQFFAALGLLVKPLKDIGEQLARFNEVKGSLADSRDVLKSGRNIKPTMQGDTDGVLYGVIDHLRVAYGATTVLTAEQLSFAKGKTVAVIGPSGGGKSSLVKCLSGLIEASEWSGRPSQGDLSSETSLVSQRPFLFRDTIRANLVYGLERPPEDEKIMARMRTLGLAGLGLDDVFDPINQNLSGGQLQRLVILRALLREKKILLLDEATSALDTEVEEKIILALFEQARQEGTILVAVTHRLGFLNQFDEVWFVEGGQVAANGPHDELLKVPRYREFVTAGVS